MKRIMLALFVAATMSMAESMPHTHDGFFLNLALGFGGQGFDYKAKGGNGTLDADGSSMELDWKIGGRVSENLILHATICGVRGLTGVEATYNGKTRTYDESSEQMNLYAIGTTYYLSSNIFLSGSIGIAGFVVDAESDGDVDGASKAGFGFQVAVGKEWWISDNWGIGIEAALVYGSADDKNDAGEMSGLALNVMFSATFN